MTNKQKKLMSLQDAYGYFSEIPKEARQVIVCQIRENELQNCECRILEGLIEILFPNMNPTTVSTPEQIEKIKRLLERASHMFGDGTRKRTRPVENMEEFKLYLKNLCFEVEAFSRLFEKMQLINKDLKMQNEHLKVQNKNLQMQNNQLAKMLEDAGGEGSDEEKGESGK